MWAIARTFTPLNADEMSKLAHSETPARVTPAREYVSYELAEMRSLANLEEVEKLKDIASSLSIDDIIKNTPGLVEEIKDSIRSLPDSEFYSFEEVFS